VKPDIWVGLSPISSAVGFLGGYPSRFMQVLIVIIRGPSGGGKTTTPYRSPFSLLKIAFSESADLRTTLVELKLEATFVAAVRLPASGLRGTSLILMI